MKVVVCFLKSLAEIGECGQVVGCRCAQAFQPRKKDTWIVDAQGFVRPESRIGAEAERLLIDFLVMR